MITKITLIRHGETVWNANRRWQGWAPVPLSDNGRQQAHDAAIGLQTAGITRIISSDLTRCLQTAEIISTILNLPFSADARLREVNVGLWQGLTRDEIRTWDAERYAENSSADQHIVAFPGGESYLAVTQRSTTAISEIVDRYPGEHALLVTHGGTIRSIVNGLAQSAQIDWYVNCSLTRLHYNNEYWQVIGMGEIASAVAW